MDYRRLGGLKVSSLCLGAMTFGEAGIDFGHPHDFIGRLQGGW